MGMVLLTLAMILIAFIMHSNALSVEMNRDEPYCFGIMGNATQNFYMNYHVMGKGASQIEYTLYDPQNVVIKQGTGNKTDTFTLQIFKDGLYNT
jgi:spore coat protein U-like protein